MEISEHFRELRWRTLVCLLCFGVFTACAFYAAPFLWPIAKHPLILSDTVTLVNLSPAEGISATLQLAGMLSALISAPVFLYHAYAFCAPAIRENRRKFVAISLILSCALFYTGAAFAYCFAIPLLLSFLANYSESATQMWAQSAYVSFLFRFVCLFAVAFLMPVFAAFFARTGIADKNFPMRHFRIVLFLIALFSAIVTPPDLLSLFWMALPLTALYGLSLITYKIAWRRR